MKSQVTEGQTFFLCNVSHIELMVLFKVATTHIGMPQANRLNYFFVLTVKTNPDIYHPYTYNMHQMISYDSHYYTKKIHKFLA